MATIKSQLVLKDAMTGPLKKINKTLGLVISGFEEMQSASGHAVNLANIQNAKKELASLARSLEEVEQSSEGAGIGIGKIAVALGAVALAKKAFDVLQAGIDYASDLAEAQNVVDVAFGDSASIVNNWAKTTTDAYGINELSAKKYAGAMGAMLKSSGLTGTAVSDMSTKIVGLAGDMASFYNLGADEAFAKIRSGISGETEPLKQLGINMSVANLEAYALSQGIEKEYKAMSQAEQVMLRYNYLLSVTGDAQGDFARTSDSFANQTKKLSENWTQLTGLLAADTLPVLAALAGGLNSTIGFLSEHSETVSAVLLGMAAGLGVLAAAWAVETAVKWASVAANQALVASMFSNPFLYIALAVGILVGALYRFITSVGGVRNAWELAKLAILVAWLGLKLGFMTGVYAVLGFTDKLCYGFQAAGVAVANAVGSMKVKTLTQMQNMINSAISLLNSFIAKLNAIPGVNIAVIEQVSFAAEAGMKEEAEKMARESALEATKLQNDMLAKSRSEKLAGLQTELEASKTSLGNAYASMRAEAKANKSEGLGGGVAGDIAASTNDIAESGKQTAGNTAAAAGALAKTSEDLKYLKDIAEQETINRFTTAEIKVEMTNNNTVNNANDLDGMVSSLSELVSDAMESVAKGVPT